ncbi:hypothetical protein SDC9_162353 [bioreactor metagenome]|uniref:Uncharacterized protein n=1 Tax=bioreactor metagenome TaxID=1076179 RepID=A0A645FS58_9ZZZZ
MAVIRQRHGHAEFFANLLGLPKDHLKNRAIHRVVFAVNERRANDGTLLTEPIHPAFALLMARGIPGKIVMNNSVEMLLKVHPLRKAIRGNE